MSLFEVFTPAFQSRIQVLNDSFHIVSSGSFGLLADGFFEFLDTFATDRSLSSLKTVPEKFKSLPFFQAVSPMGLFWMKFQPDLLSPGLNLKQGLPGLLFTPTQHHKIIRIAHPLEVLLSHEFIQWMQGNVRQQRRQDASLRSPSVGSPGLPLPPDFLGQELPDDPQQWTITDPALELLLDQSLPQRIEETLQIRIHPPLRTFLDERSHFPQCVFGSALWAKAITLGKKFLLKK